MKWKYIRWLSQTGRHLKSHWRWECKIECKTGNAVEFRIFCMRLSFIWYIFRNFTYLKNQVLPGSLHNSWGKVSPPEHNRNCCLEVPFFFHWPSRSLGWLQSSLTRLTSVKIHSGQNLFTHKPLTVERHISTAIWSGFFLLSGAWGFGLVGLLVWFFVCLVVFLFWSRGFFCIYNSLKNKQNPRWADIECIVVNESFASDSPMVSILPLYTN